MAVLGVELSKEFARIKASTENEMKGHPAAFTLLIDRVQKAKSGDFEALQMIGQRIVEIAALFSVLGIDSLDELCAFVHEKLSSKEGNEHRMADLLKRIAKMREQRMVGVGHDTETDAPPDISHLTVPVPADSEMKMQVGSLPLSPRPGNGDPLEDL